MADSTDIDALVIQARATARELNELLEKLEAGGVQVSVVQRPPSEGYQLQMTRVSLGLVFLAQGLPAFDAGAAVRANLLSAAMKAPQQQGTPLGLSPREAMEHARKLGLLR